MDKETKLETLEKLLDPLFLNLLELKPEKDSSHNEKYT